MVANILFSQTLLPSNNRENDFIFVFLMHLVLITGLGYGNLESFGKPRLCESRMYCTGEPIKTDLNRKKIELHKYILLITYQASKPDNKMECFVQSSSRH